MASHLARSLAPIGEGCLEAHLGASDASSLSDPVPGAYPSHMFGVSTSVLGIQNLSRRLYWHETPIDAELMRASAVAGPEFVTEPPAPSIDRRKSME